MITKTIELTEEEKELFDAHDLKCKDVLSYKIILANIMKRCIPEYQDCDIQTIYDCIEKDNNLKSEKILGLNNDFGFMKYDLFFSSALPDNSNAIGLFVNLEPQGNTKYIKYNMFNRSLFYACHGITYQYKKIFDHMNYQLMKKVYSVFICFEAPSKEEENSLTYFYLTKDVKIGYNIYEGYDKICMIIIYLGNEESQIELFRLIRILFANKLNVNDKVKLLNDEFDIQMNKPFIEEVHEMCSLSERISAISFEEGISKGIEQGKERATFDYIKSLMESLNFTLEQAMSALKLSDELKDTCREYFK